MRNLSMRSLLMLALLTSRLALGQTCKPAPDVPLACPAPASLQTFGTIRACDDPTLGMPRWAAAWYQHSKTSIPRDFCVWRKTPGMPAPALYSGTGYDKGHLIAFADIACSAEAAALTCQTGNIAPQPPQDNQTTWARFEGKLRDWADKADHGAPVLFVAGPSFTAPPLWVRSGLRRPSGFWKVALTSKGACGYAALFGSPQVRPVAPSTLGFQQPLRSDCLAP